MNAESRGGSGFPTIGSPDELRQAAGRLYNLPLTSKSELEALINQYADDIEQAAAQRHDLDVNLAACIADCCGILLNEEWDKAEDRGKRLIQVACHYFFESDDQDGDLESVYGFDDDAELVNEILKLLNRQDLTIQI